MKPPSSSRLQHSLRSFVLLAAVLMAPSAALAGCPDLPPPALRVFALAADSGLDIFEPTDTARKWPHSFISIDTVVAGRVAIDSIAVLRDAAFCPVPRQVIIALGLSTRLVRLPVAAFRDECLKNELIAHAAKHLAAEDRTVDLFVADTYDELGRLLGSFRATPAPSAESAQTAFETGAERLVADARDRLDAAVRQASGAVDTDETLTALRQACGGRVQRIEQFSERRSQL